MLEFAIRYAYNRRVAELYEPIIKYAALVEKGVLDEYGGQTRTTMFGIPADGLNRRRLASATYVMFHKLIAENEKFKAGPQHDYVTSPRKLPDPATEPVVDKERIANMAPRARELMNLPYDDYLAARNALVREWSSTPNALLKALLDLPPLEKAIWGGIFARVMYPEQVELLESQLTSAKIELADPPVFAIRGNYKTEIFNPMKVPVLSNWVLYLPYKEAVAKHTAQFFDDYREYYSHIVITICEATGYFLEESLVVGRGEEITDGPFLAKKSLYGDPTTYFAIRLLERLCESDMTPLNSELIVQDLLRPGMLDIPLNLNYALHYAVENKEKRFYRAIIEHKELIHKGIEDTIDGKKVVSLFGNGPRPDGSMGMFYRPLQELAWIENQLKEEQPK